MTASGSGVWYSHNSYILPVVPLRYVMKHLAARLTVFVLYQLTVLFGILLLPVALLGRRLGLRLPVATLLDRMDAAYDRTAN